MTLAATTSPFINHTSSVAPWIVWTKSEPVFTLIEEKQTDGRFSEGNVEHIKQPESINPVATSFQIQTNRYHAVLDKMDRANKMASKFSSWSS